MNKKVYIGIVAIVLVGLVFMFIRGGSSTGSVINADIIEDIDAIKIPLSDISSNAQFYEYEGVEYFIVEASDGTPKTAINACDVCYKSKKGYSQKGGDMVCNNCGNHYPISGLGTANLRGGGCWPGYLPSSVEGEYLVIQKSNINAKKYMFA